MDQWLKEQILTKQLVAPSHVQPANLHVLQRQAEPTHSQGPEDEVVAQTVQVGCWSAWQKRPCMPDLAD